MDSNGIEKLLADIRAHEPDCPTIPRMYDALRLGWTAVEASHITACPRCNKRIAMYWQEEEADKSLLPAYLESLDPSIYLQALGYGPQLPLPVASTSRVPEGRQPFLAEVAARLQAFFNPPRVAVNRSSAEEEADGFADADGLKIQFRRVENETVQVVVTHPLSSMSGRVFRLKVTADRIEREVEIPVMWLGDACHGVKVLGPFEAFQGAQNLQLELDVFEPLEGEGK